MFKKLRLWLIKKLNATPNEAPNTKFKIEHVAVPIKKWNFKKIITETSMCKDTNYLEHRLLDQLYLELKQADVIKLKSNYDPTTDITTYYATIAVGQED